MTSTLTVALVYTRVSTDEQATKGLSLDTQLSECRQYVLRQGWSIGHEYSDILSGMKDTRPSYQELLGHARALRAQGIAVVVVVAALDRFGRRLLERVRSREELKALGVPTHSCREGGEVSDLVANILATVAQEEVRRLGERIQASRRYMISLGWKPPARASLGYLWRTATDSERQMGSPKVVLDIDTVTAPTVREAYTRVAEGLSVRKVTGWLRSLPSEQRGGLVLSFATVQNILSIPVYVSRPDHGDDDVLSRPLQRWPAIVDDATWAKVQTYIRDHAYHHHQATGRYLLVGYIRCPRCGARVVGSTYPRDNIARYRCSTLSHGGGTCMWTLRCSTLDRPVLREVSRMLGTVANLNPAALADSWERLANPGEIVGYRQKRLASLRAEVAAAKERLLKTTRMYVDGQIEQGGYELIRDDAQQAIAGGEAEIARLTVAPGPILPPLSSTLDAIGPWSDLIEGAAIETALKREVLALLVASVDVERIPPAEGRVKGKYTTRVRWSQLGEALRAVGRESRRLTAYR